MTRTPVIPQTLFKETDKDGTSFFVVDRFGNQPEVEVCFEGGGLIIRQEFGDYVAVVDLSLGMANDILMAISCALNIPVRVQ